MLWAYGHEKYIYRQILKYQDCPQTKMVQSTRLRFIPDIRLPVFVMHFFGRVRDQVFLLLKPPLASKLDAIQNVLMDYRFAFIFKMSAIEMRNQALSHTLSSRTGRVMMLASIPLSVGMRNPMNTIKMCTSSR